MTNLLGAEANIAAPMAAGKQSLRATGRSLRAQRASPGFGLFVCRQHASFNDASDQGVWNGPIEGDLQVTLRPRVLFHGSHEAIASSHRRKNADVPFECREIDQDAIQLIRRHSIADGFFGFRCSRFNRLTYLLENDLNIRWKGRDVIVYRLRHLLSRHVGPRIIEGSVGRRFGLVEPLDTVQVIWSQIKLDCLRRSPES